MVYYRPSPSGPFDLIQRAVSTDGTLSLNVQGIHLLAPSCCCSRVVVCVHVLLSFVHLGFGVFSSFGLLSLLSMCCHSTFQSFSVRLLGDLSQGTRRLLLQATVSATGSSTPVGVGGVTLLDADVVWSSSPSSAAATGTKSARARAESVSGAGSGGAREAKQWWPPPPYMRDPGSSFG